MIMNKWFRKSILTWFSAILFSMPILFILPDYTEAKCTYVSSYTKKNGTRVSGYYRGCGATSAPSETKPNIPTNTNGNNYYGSSKIINLYKGKNSIGANDTDKLVYVKGYYKKDGTYIRPHYRTHPNNYLTDNFSYLGISSLSPKQKHPKFTYNIVKDIALKEKYLLYNLSDKKLNEKQLTSLKGYAIALNEAESNKQKEQSVIREGTQFYKDLGYNDELAISNTKFDLYGELTLEYYLYNVIYSINPVYPDGIGDTHILDTYAYLLKEASEDPTKLKIARNFGAKFYKLVGAEHFSIEGQLEMDELQPFDISNTNTTDWPITHLNSNNGYSLPSGAVRDYLMSVGAYYNILFDSKIILDSISYQVSLELLYNGSAYSLNSAFTEGIKFYKNHGLSNEDAELQTIKDINAILAS